MLISNHLECEKCGQTNKNVTYESGKIPLCPMVLPSKSKQISGICGGKRIVVWEGAAPCFSL